jgi:hypothetical protein
MAPVRVAGIINPMHMFDVKATLQLRGGGPETVPLDEPLPDRRGAIDYMLDRIRRDLPSDGPLHPGPSLIGHRKLDTALASARARRTLPLVA